MNQESSAKNKFSGSVVTSLIYKNVILSAGLALPFAIVTATDYRNALALSIAMLVSNLPTMVLMSLLRKTRLSLPIRRSILCMVSLSLVLLSSLVVRYISLTIFDSLGSYFYMLGINTITIVRGSEEAPKLSPIAAAADGLLNSLGFALAVFAVAVVRELLGSGSFFGKVLWKGFRLNGMLIPFGGFITVAFIAALFSTLKRHTGVRLFRRKNETPASEDADAEEVAE